MNPAAAARRLQRHWRSHGALRTLRFVSSRIVRCWRAVVFEADLNDVDTTVEWAATERLTVFGPENIDTEMSPDLAEFLGGERAFESIESVRQGDRLFVVSDGRTYQHRGYIMFNTRQCRILGEKNGTPMIGDCETAPASRGRALYRRALKAELAYLRRLGYPRVVIETHPQNTASRRGIEAAGFSAYRDVTAWIVLNWLVFRRIVEGSRRKWNILLV